MSEFERMLDDLESLTADERRALKAAAHQGPPRGAALAVWSGLVGRLPGLSGGGSGDGGPPGSSSVPHDAGSAASGSGSAAGASVPVGGSAVAKGTSTAALAGTMAAAGKLSSVVGPANAITAATLIKSLAVGVAIGLTALTAGYQMTSTHDEPSPVGSLDVAAGDARRAKPFGTVRAAALRDDTAAGPILSPETTSRVPTRGTQSDTPRRATAPLEPGAVNQCGFRRMADS